MNRTFLEREQCSQSNADLYKKSQTEVVHIAYELVNFLNPIQLNVTLPKQFVQVIQLIIPTREY